MSRYSSSPSRQRSPMPQKMLTPSCCPTMLWIISVSSTVLPTPAPPNSPALPPRSSGISTSITLMPVSKTSGLGRTPRQRRRRPVHGAPLHIGRRGLAIDRVAEHVEHAREHALADRRLQRPAGIAPPPCRRPAPGSASAQSRARGAHPAAPAPRSRSGCFPRRAGSSRSAANVRRIDSPPRCRARTRPRRVLSICFCRPRYRSHWKIPSPCAPTRAETITRRVNSAPLIWVKVWLCGSSGQ